MGFPISIIIVPPGYTTQPQTSKSGGQNSSARVMFFANKLLPVPI